MRSRDFLCSCSLSDVVQVEYKHVHSSLMMLIHRHVEKIEKYCICNFSNNEKTLHSHTASKRLARG
jgi:hypothetical protein